MSNQKLTPRQRMINMMYLVLIAMLALNVSREILKSFHLFELSFINANKASDKLNMEMMSSFKEKYTDKNTRVKTEKWYLRARQVHQISTDFTNYVEQLKSEVISKGGGRAEPEKGESGITELATPDDMENHAYYFSEEGKGNGRKLKVKINATRELMLKLLDSVRNGAAIINSLRQNTQLRAEDPKKTNSEFKTWENVYLENAPLAGVATLLTKTQNDCKALEADILNVLSENITINNLTHDGQIALIIPESRYVMSGSSFNARIALATYDKTAPQKIIVNGKEITVNQGFGNYTVPASGTGNYKVDAKIETIDPLTGKPTFIDAEPVEWSSFQPSATISADAMNVLFVGLDNPMSISVPGVTPENTFVTASNGVTLTRSGSGKYIAKANGQFNSSVVSVSVRMQDGTVRKMGETTYRVRLVPQPKLKIGTLSSGVYSKARLMMQPTINAVLENFYFNDVRFTVYKYTAILVSGKNGLDIRNVEGNGPTEFRELVKKAKSGETIYIDFAKARGPAGRETGMDPISLKIE